MSEFFAANFSLDGKCSATFSVRLDELNAETLTHFEKRLSRLPDDLDLPLDSELPGELSDIDYRIVTDGAGAYVLYYYDEEAIFASLLLPGVNAEQENELLQVFRFLLLDDEDLDEPTDEEIEAVLAGSPDRFDFESFMERPVMVAIRFFDPDFLDDDDEASDIDVEEKEMKAGDVEDQPETNHDPIDDEPETDEDELVMQAVEAMNQHLAAVFFRLRGVV